jgi:hypothetical protein
MRPVLVSTVLVAAAIMLAGCGSSTLATSDLPTATPTLVPTVAATPTATPEPTPTPTATPPIPCKPGQFDIAILNTQGAAGTIYATFEVRNSTTSDCTENGYAKLQMLGSGGAMLTTSWTNTNAMASPGPVDLPPGTEPVGAAGATGHGYFLVSWTDATCSQAQAEMPKFWQVTLPTSGFQTDVTDIDTSMVCGGAIKVDPIKPAPYT